MDLLLLGQLSCLRRCGRGGAGVGSTRSKNKAVLNSVLACGAVLVLTRQANLFATTGDGLEYQPPSHLLLPAVPQHRTGGRVLLAKNFFVDLKVSRAEHIAGYAIGCVGMALYLGGRLPQIWRNWKRKTTKGLSASMFLMAIGGNGCYAAGILLEGLNDHFVVEHLPWLIGSLGTMVLDSIIFFQFVHYRRRFKRKMQLQQTQRVPPLPPPPPNHLRPFSPNQRSPGVASGCLIWGLGVCSLGLQLAR